MSNIPSFENWSASVDADLEAIYEEFDRVVAKNEWSEERKRNELEALRKNAYRILNEAYAAREKAIISEAIKSQILQDLKEQEEKQFWQMKVKAKFRGMKMEESHLIAQLLQAKASRNLATYASLFFGLLGEYLLYTQTQEISIAWVMTLTVALLLGNFVNQRILKYRVDHGLYGTCYSEAKEIVAFILEWQRKNGDSNHKPPKLVFTQEELNQCLQVNGGEEYAG